MSRKRKDNIGEDDMEGYDSSFDDDDGEGDEGTDTSGTTKVKRSRQADLTDKVPAPHIQPSGSSKGLPTKEYFRNEQTRAEAYRNRYFALNAFERHKKLINDYFLYHPGAADKVLRRDDSKDKRDIDVIRENHRFLWDDDKEADTWEKQLAKRYYDKLFKEYCICDLSRYKENKVAMRWRTETELVEGKGQFSCGARKCVNIEHLRTWEVNFAYVEDALKKNALVKLRLCVECSHKLNYGHQRKELKKGKKHSRHSKDKRWSKSRRRSSSNSVDDDNDKSSKPGSSKGHNVRDEEDEEQKDKEKEGSKSQEENIWKEPLAVPDVKSREEEFEDYLDDLFV